MALLVPAEGEIELLKKALLNTSDTETFTLHLFKNNATLNTSNTSASFTNADFTDYAAKTIPRTDWSTPTTNGSGKAEASLPQQSWTCGATGNTIYGYYFMGTTSGKVLWAEKFSTPVVLVSSDILNLVPIFTLDTE